MDEMGRMGIPVINLDDDQIQDEWKEKKEQKEPMFITTPDASPFAFAGLWETWNDKQNQDAAYRSCTIITRDAVSAIRELHHRMPVILHPDTYGLGL